LVRSEPIGFQIRLPFRVGCVLAVQILPLAIPVGLGIQLLDFGIGQMGVVPFVAPVAIRLIWDRNSRVSLWVVVVVVDEFGVAMETSVEVSGYGHVLDLGVVGVVHDDGGLWMLVVVVTSHNWCRRALVIGVVVVVAAVVEIASGRGGCLR